MTIRHSNNLFLTILFCSLVAVFFFNTIPGYANSVLIIDPSCLNGNLSDTMSNYVHYIDSILNSNTNDKNIRDFCNQLTEDGYKILFFLHNSIFDNHISSQLISFFNVKILEPINESALLVGLFTITIWGIIMHTLCEMKNSSPKSRKGFTRLVKHNVLNKQNYRCGQCKRMLTVVDFHHKNGDRSDDRESNCQALCPTCHAIVTRGVLKGK